MRDALLLLLLCATMLAVFLDRGECWGGGGGGARAGRARASALLPRRRQRRRRPSFAGVVASNGVNGGASSAQSQPGFAQEFGLTLFQDGLVAACFYCGIMVGAPVWAQLSKHGYNAFRLVGAGTAVFGVGAALLCGFANGLALMLVGRAVVGAGAGAIIALAPPLVGA